MLRGSAALLRCALGTSQQAASCARAGSSAAALSSGTRGLQTRSSRPSGSREREGSREGSRDDSDARFKPRRSHQRREDGSDGPRPRSGGRPPARFQPRGRAGGAGGAGPAAPLRLAFSEKVMSQIWEAQGDRDSTNADAMLDEIVQAPGSNIAVGEPALEAALPYTLDAEGHQFLHLAAGDLVEVRRLAGVCLCVILPHRDGAAGTADSLVGLTGHGGSLSVFAENDIMFHIPAFIPHHIAAAASVGSDEELNASRFERAAAFAGAHFRDESTLRARNHIFTRLRAIELARDREVQRLLPHFQQEYIVGRFSPHTPALAGGDLKGKQSLLNAQESSHAVTTFEVARRLCELTSGGSGQGQSPTSSPSQGPRRAASPPISGTRAASTSAVVAQPNPSSISLFAAHTLLMNHPEHFIADVRTHRNTSEFTRRNSDERHAWVQVQKWLAEEQSARMSAALTAKPRVGAKKQAPLRQQQQPSSVAEGPVESFCRRARFLREERKRILSRQGGQDKPGEITATPFPPLPNEETAASSSSGHFEWTEEDLVILRFLRLALDARRAIQDDLFKSVAMDIVKRAGGVPALPPREYVPMLDFTGMSDSQIREMHAQFQEKEAVLAKQVGFSAPGLLTATHDQVFARIAQFMVDIGEFAPWSNLQVMDTTLRASIESAKRMSSNPHAAQARSSAVRPSTEADSGVKRRDFGSLVTYVIDDATAHELDDGVSIEATSDPEEWWVHVHVADPAPLLSPQSPLARHAQSQGCTVYFPDARYPLLPEELVGRADMGRLTRSDPSSSSSSSSLAGADRTHNVLTFSAKIHEKTGKVSDFAVGASTLSRVNVCTYSAVQALFDGTDGSASGGASFTEADKSALHTLRRITTVLGAQRIRQGMFTTSNPTADIRVQPAPLPDTVADRSRPHVFGGAPEINIELVSSRTVVPGKTSQGMVGELMVLGGRVMGAWAHEHNLPVPYRAQIFAQKLQTGRLQGSEEALRAFLREHQDPLTGAVDTGALLRIGALLPRMSLSDRPQSHLSMGVTMLSPSSAAGDVLSRAGYVRCTSPLRRYADLFVHWQVWGALKALAQGELPAHSRHVPWRREALLPELSRFLRHDRWSRDLHRAATRHWAGVHVARLLALEASGRADEMRPEDRAFLAPAPATLRSENVRAVRTMDATVEALADGLGVQASCEWTKFETAPELGQQVLVKPVYVSFAGLRTQIVVRRV